MANSICYLSLILLCIYIGIYTIYYALSVYFASKARRIITKHKFYNPPYENNIIMVIYCADDQGDVVSLLEMMNKQDYPKTNYQTHIILDNCSDDISNKLEFIGGAKIWRLGDGAAVGKDESISWLLERLVSLQNVNAFAFLNAKRKIGYDYLSNINKALFQNDVVVAQTEIVDSRDTLSSKIKTAYNLYSNRISMLARTAMGFSAIIDSDACALKQEVIEKIRCVDFKDVESELKYTTLLIKSGFDCLYNPCVITKLDVQHSINRKPLPLYRFDILRHCIGLFLGSRVQFIEFVINSVKPNIWVLLLSYIAMIIFTSTYYFIFDIKLVSAFAAILVISFIASLFVADLGKGNIKYLLLYPIYRTCKNIEKSKFYSSLTKIFKPKQNYINRDMLTVDVIVTGGKVDLPCYLDLISEDGLAHAVLRYKKKRYVSAKQIRMYDAVTDIVEKLDENGFRIKVCHSCGFFTQKIDGSTNVVKGECMKCKMKSSACEPTETLIWSTCADYAPRELGKVIDIKNYRN